MIFVDDRIGSRELAHLINDSILVNLDFGDVSFSGNGPQGEVQIGIERKTCGDLINSITTGRLSGHQLPGLLDTYYKVYLIVEGVCRESQTKELEILKGKKWVNLQRGGRKFRYRDVWSFLTTLETFTGVIIRHTSNMVETANQIEYLYSWWSKPWTKHRGHLQLHKLPPPSALLRPGKPSLIRRMASELVGVGWERATAVEKHFGSVRRMFEAEESEWRKIDGIGKLTARKAFESLHE